MSLLTSWHGAVSLVAGVLAFALMGQKDESKIRAVQFHPNLSYEDFVRGWRPSGDGKLALVLQGHALRSIIFDLTWKPTPRRTPVLPPDSERLEMAELEAFVAEQAFEEFGFGVEIVIAIARFPRGGVRGATRSLSGEQRT